MNKLSREALLDFLDYLSSKGLMNKTTASARKAAANKVLGVLDDEEASDVTKVDLDHVMTRFHNLEGTNYTPESLSTYKSRVKSAIDDFMRYQADPLNFKPTVSSVGRRPSDRLKATTPSSVAKQRLDRAPERSVQPPPASVDILPIPIRSGLTIKIQGLPFDLTEAEANKIANVIKAMAQPD